MLPFDEILERIKNILSNEIGARRVFDKDVAVVLGLEPSYFAVLKRRQSLPLSAVADFCAQRKISINWLLYDQIPQSLEESTERFASVRYFRNIHASAGGGAFNEEEEAERLIVDEKIVPMLGGQKALKAIDAIQVIGDSMEPEISEGSTIFINRDFQEIGGGGIFVVQTPGGVFVKRLMLKSSGDVELVSSNMIYPTETLRSEEVAVIGKVVGVLEHIG